jgi:KipI family sensor histidine kinase inhibitor
MATRSVPVGEIRRMGEHALLIGVADPVAARQLVRLVTTSGWRAVREVVGGVATVLVTFDPDEDEPDDYRARLAHVVEASRRAGGEDVAAIAASEVTIPSAFEGPDLPEVATELGCTPEKVVEMLTAAALTVDVVGFSPGFAYLGGLPPEFLGLPRRASPRPVVPPGSIGLAHGYAAVYPAASPGGWHLIGHTDEVMFSPWEAPYARLAPGDRVRFTIVAGGSSWTPAPGRAAPVAYPETARPVFAVEEIGLRTVLQDAGRQRVAALGVPGATPADPCAFALANQLVGNVAGAATLEVLARGPTLRCLSPTFVAVVGGSPDLRLDGQPFAAGRVVPVNAGQQLRVGAVHGGLRTYVAIAGGFLGPSVLGSLATDQLSGLGPGPLAPGARLWAGAMEPPLGDHLADEVTVVADGAAPTKLRVVPGPHAEQFASGAFESLAETGFIVDADSNRVGLRLRRDPSTPPVRRAAGRARELDSQGMVTGAVQVPPSGDPVILLGDHATLGGYPVVAVVAAVDHGVLGQCAPGALIALVPTDHDEAKVARLHQRRHMAGAVVGHYPFAVG